MKTILLSLAVLISTTLLVDCQTADAEIYKVEKLYENPNWTKSDLQIVKKITKMETKMRKLYYQKEKNTKAGRHSTSIEKQFSRYEKVVVGLESKLIHPRIHRNIKSTKELKEVLKIGMTPEEVLVTCGRRFSRCDNNPNQYSSFYDIVTKASGGVVKLGSMMYGGPAWSIGTCTKVTLTFNSSGLLETIQYKKETFET